jgi:hypothetical protein
LHPQPTPSPPGIFSIKNDLIVTNIDIKMAYLHHEDQLAKLNNLELYGLAESGKLWNDLANQHMDTIVSKRPVCDSAAFIDRKEDGQSTKVSLHQIPLWLFRLTQASIRQFPRAARR